MFADQFVDPVGRPFPQSLAVEGALMGMRCAGRVLSLLKKIAILQYAPTTYLLISGAECSSWMALGAKVVQRYLLWAAIVARVLVVVIGSFTCLITRQKPLE